MHLSSIVLLLLQGGAAWKVPHQAFNNFVFSNGQQIPLGLNDDDDIETYGADSIAGLRTFANLPFVDCFSNQDVKSHQYDIAIFGAPHDTVSQSHRPFFSVQTINGSE